MGGFYRLISEGAREDGYASWSAKSLIPRLLGDKDHEKVFNDLAKVENIVAAVTAGVYDDPSQGERISGSERNGAAGCYNFGKGRHFQGNCNQQK